MTRSNRISWTSKYGMSWFHCVWVKRQFVATPLVMQRQLSITQRDGRMGGWEDGRHVGVMEVEAMICTSYSIKGL